MDAIYEHEFVLDGKTKEIYLAEEKPGQVFRHAPSVVLVRSVTVAPKSNAVCNARIVSEFKLPQRKSYCFFPKSLQMNKEIQKNESMRFNKEYEIRNKAKGFNKKKIRNEPENIESLIIEPFVNELNKENTVEIQLINVSDRPIYLNKGYEIGHI